MKVGESERERERERERLAGFVRSECERDNTRLTAAGSPLIVFFFSSFTQWKPWPLLKHSNAL